MGGTIRMKRIKRITLPDGIEGPQRVKVGYPAGKTSTDIVDRAIWNHYGTSRGIPARPFLLNAVQSNRGKYINALRTSAAKILKGQTNLTQVMSKLGILAQGDVQRQIDMTLTPPNAPSTIAAKKSSHPLIDTGEMRQKTTWAFDT